MTRRAPDLIHAMQFKSHPRHPPVSFTTLCQQLELELHLGQHAAFRRRLERTIHHLLQQQNQ